MLLTFFLSEIPLLNVRWKSLSVIYKMIQLVKTHDVSKLDSLFDRACCDPQQISQLSTVLRNTFTDITFWPLKTHKPPKKFYSRISKYLTPLIAYSLGKFLLSVLWSSLLPNICTSNPRTITRARKAARKLKKKKNAVRGAVAMYPTAGKSHFKIDLTTWQSENDFVEFHRNSFPYWTSWKLTWDQAQF